MKHLNPIQLKKLHSDFVKYRDSECGGLSDVGIDVFYEKNQRDYENFKLNQCDGCMSDLPIVDGLHRDSCGRPVMACCAGLYA